MGSDILAHSGGRFGSNDPNYVGQYGLNVNPSTCPLWRRVWVDRPNLCKKGWGLSQSYTCPLWTKVWVDRPKLCKGGWGLIQSYTCPLWRKVWVERPKLCRAIWALSQLQYLPTMEKGLGRPTQTM